MNPDLTLGHVAMKCPKCGREMGKGILAGSRDIFWMDKPHISPSFSGYVLRGPPKLWSGRLEAFICEDCRMITAHYLPSWSEWPEGEVPPKEIDYKWEPEASSDQK